MLNAIVVNEVNTPPNRVTIKRHKNATDMLVPIIIIGIVASPVATNVDNNPISTEPIEPNDSVACSNIQSIK